MARVDRAAQMQLEEAIRLIRAGDLDPQDENEPRLASLMKMISDAAEVLPSPDLSEWPCEKNADSTLFSLRAGALLREYVEKRPASLYQREKLAIPRLDKDALLQQVSILSEDLKMNPTEHDEFKTSLLRSAIRALTFATIEKFRLNKNNEIELDQMITKFEQLLRITDVVLATDRKNQNLALKAELLYHKGRAQREKGTSVEEAELSFTECLKLARRRLERYSGDPGQSNYTVEYRHSAYLAAQTLLQLAFLTYLEGHLSRSRKLITASWFIIYPCRDQRTKAEIQYLTAAVRRASTNDRGKQKEIVETLQRVDDTLGNLKIVTERQMALVDKVLTHCALGEFETAHGAVRLISDLAQEDRYWIARSKVLEAHIFLERSLPRNQNSESLIEKAGILLEHSSSVFRQLSSSSELVQSICLQAQVAIAAFEVTGNSRSLHTAEFRLNEAEQMNRLIKRLPRFGEMDAKRNQGLVTLLQAKVKLLFGHFVEASELLHKWDVEFSKQVETQSLQDLRAALRQFVPWRSSTLEVRADKSFDELRRELARLHYQLIRLDLEKKRIKPTDQLICEKMDIDPRLLKKLGVIKKRRYRFKSNAKPVETK